MTPANDGRRETVVDKINSHHHGNEAQRSQVELEGCEHEFRLGAPTGGRTNHRIGRCNLTQGSDDTVQRKRVFHENLNGGEESTQVEQLLSPTNIHRGNARIRCHSGIVRLEIKSMLQHERATSRENAEFRGRGATGWQGNDIWLAQPPFQVEWSTRRVDEFEDTEARAGEGIDPENPQVVARHIWQRGDPLDQRSSRTDARRLGNKREKLLGQIAPDFQICPASDETNGILETRQGPAIGHLNRQENRNTNGNPENIQER